jgi:hypothetical protein
MWRISTLIQMRVSETKISHSLAPPCLPLFICNHRELISDKWATVWHNRELVSSLEYK